LCDNERDFIKHSELLANNDDLRKTMRHAALDKLNDKWGKEHSMKSWAIVFDQWEKL
jgi:hypothetical protein